MFGFLMRLLRRERCLLCGQDRRKNEGQYWNGWYLGPIRDEEG